MTEFGELRSLAHGTPSARAWQALCEGVLTLPEATREAAIDYLDGALRGWPDALRTLPFDTRSVRSHLTDYMPQPAHASLLRLVRDLCVTPGRFGGLGWSPERHERSRLDALGLYDPSAQQISEALRAPATRQLKTLRLISPTIGTEAIRQVIADAPSTLQELSIGSRALVPEDLQLLASSRIASQLRALAIHNPTGWSVPDPPMMGSAHARPDEVPWRGLTRPREDAPDAASLIAALAHPNLAQLEALTLTRCVWDEDAAIQLALLPALPTLRTLTLTGHLPPDRGTLSQALHQLTRIEALTITWQETSARWIAPERFAQLDLRPIARLGTLRAAHRQRRAASDARAGRGAGPLAGIPHA